MEQSFLTSSVWLLVCAAVLMPAGARAADDPSGAKLGAKIGDVVFKDAAGKTASLHGLAGKKATVVVFLNFDCPNSTGYSPILADLASRYRDRGVAFVGVCPCGDETAASIAAKAAECRLAFSVYKDDNSAAVEALKAECTPEAFLLDHNLVLRYRGRIDDAYSARLKKNLTVTHHDLRNALDELLAGKAVSTPLTKAVGCPVFMEGETRADGKVTYYRDVLPILQNNCQSCHRPGQVGPFALMTYRQAVNWASDIKEYTRTRQMPPWKITEGIAFHNERKLTGKEIETLAAWVDSGKPEGNPKDAPPAKKFTDGWMLGTPDLVLQPKEDFVLGPGGPDLFRCYVLPTGLTEDHYVVAIEVKPSNPRVVHHTLNFSDASGQGHKLEEEAQAKEKGKKESEYDRGPGYSVAMGIGFLPSGGLGGWAPGQLGHKLPDGYGWPLPKGADVVLQVHYHRDGRLEKDRTKIGLYLAKKGAGTKPYKGGVIPGRFFAIPAGDSHYKVTGTLTVAQECELRTIMPHMHLIGRQIKVTLEPASGGTKQTLLAIEDWDYNWQETYFLEKPLKLKPGDVLHVEAIYDNTSKNANNPNNPPRAVFFGEQTTNEMCFVFLGATSDGPGRTPFVRPGRLLRPAAEQPKETKP
jgi:hypothetical protein